MIVPVFLTETDLQDPEATVESSAYKPVLDVLRALRAHDPELLSDADRIAASLGPRDAVTSGHIADHVRFLGHAVDLKAIEQALELRFVEVTADRFKVGLAHLAEYVRAHGDARVPQTHLSPDDYRLGSWVSQCRADYTKGRLAPERIAELEAVDGWTWDARVKRRSKG